MVDLADPVATQRVADELVAAHPDTTLLVNNAGVALGGRFDQVTLDEFDWVMEINFRSVVRLTKAFLPTLKAHPGSHVVNLSSLFGLMAPAGQAAYSLQQVRRPHTPTSEAGGRCVSPWLMLTRVSPQRLRATAIDGTAMKPL